MRAATGFDATPGGGLSEYWTRPSASTQRWICWALTGMLANSAQSAMIAFSPSSQELQAREAGIEPALRHELGVRALRDDRAALEHHDAVGGLHRGQPVRDGERGAALLARFEPLLHQALGRRVERAGGLVQQQDGTVGEQGARDRQALLLAAGQREGGRAQRGGEG